MKTIDEPIATTTEQSTKGGNAMPTNLISKTIIKELAAKASGLDNDQGNARHKEIVNRLLHDLMIAIDELDISMDEFRAGAGYLGEAAKANELGLVVPGIALEHFLDLRLDEAERRAGLTGGTTRTIEGPLYVAGAPLAKGETRLDDGTDDGEILFMEGRVLDTAGCRRDRRCLAREFLRLLFVLRPAAVVLQSSPPDRDRPRWPLPLPLHHAVRLWLPARIEHRDAAC